MELGARFLPHACACDHFVPCFTKWCSSFAQCLRACLPSLAARPPLSPARSSGPQRDFFLAVCESALAALLFDAFDVRPSRNTEEAFVAVCFVVFFEVLRWDSVLPAALFDLAPVDLLLSVFDALFAALDPVFFVAMVHLSVGDAGSEARMAPGAFQIVRRSLSHASVALPADGAVCASSKEQTKTPPRSGRAYITQDCTMATASPTPRSPSLSDGRFAMRSAPCARGSAKTMVDEPPPSRFIAV